MLGRWVEEVAFERMFSESPRLGIISKCALRLSAQLRMARRACRKLPPPQAFSLLAMHHAMRSRHRMLRSTNQASDPTF